MLRVVKLTFSHVEFCLAYIFVKMLAVRQYRTVGGIEARTWGTVSSNHGVWSNSFGGNVTI